MKMVAALACLVAHAFSHYVAVALSATLGIMLMAASGVGFILFYASYMHECE